LPLVTQKGPHVISAPADTRVVGVAVSDADGNLLYHGPFLKSDTEMGHIEVVTGDQQVRYRFWPNRKFFAR